MKIPKLVSNSAIYAVFNVLQRALNFFLLPLYTVYLSPEDYGVTNVLVAACALLTFLLTFSIQAASARFHYKYSKNQKIVKQIWGSNLVFVLLNSCIWVTFFCIFYDYSIYFLIGDEISFYPYSLLAILNCSFSPIYLYFQIYLQTIQRAKFYVINNLLFFLCQLTLTIYFVVGWELKALGVISAQLIVNFVFAIYAIWALRRFVTYKFSLKILRRSLSYSVPLIPHNLSGWLTNMLDRIFINRIVDIANVGLYSVSNQIGSIVNIIGLSINQAYVPYFFQNHTTNSGRKKLVNTADLGILFLLLVGLFIAYFAQEIVYFMTSIKYYSVWPAIVILVAANLFDCIYRFYVMVLFLEKTIRLSIITISCSLFTCALNYLLITLFGYIGAAITYVIVQFSESVLVCIYSRKIRPDIKFNSILHYSEIFISLLFLVITLLLVKKCNIENRIIIKLISYCLLAFTLFFLNHNNIAKLYKMYVTKK